MSGVLQTVESAALAAVTTGVGAVATGASPLQAVEQAATAVASLPDMVNAVESRVTALEAKAESFASHHPVLAEIVGILGKYFPHEIGALAAKL